jgi:rfaE bifunctional protein nucleotidyltransferase chain/domain
MSVIRNFDEAIIICEQYRCGGLTVGLCHGCFDIVHYGHIYHLQQARAEVDRLFVSVTGDQYVNKGPDRPIFPEASRAQFMAAIRYCDHVIISSSPTAEDVIAGLLPHIYFKGPDYSDCLDPRVRAEWRVLEKYGGRIVFTDSAIFDSTSRIASFVPAETHPGYGAAASEDAIAEP